MIKKHNFFWYGLSFSIKSIIPLVSLPWFSKFLSLEEFGIFALSIFFGTFISGISNLGLLNVFERNYFEISEEQRKNFLFSVVIFVLCIISSSTFIVFLFQKSLSILIFRDSAIAEFLIYGLFFTGIKSLNQYFYTYLKNQKAGKVFSILSIIESVTNIFIALILVINLNLGIKGFFLGQTLGSLLVFFFFCLYCFNHGYTSFNLKLLTQSLKLSLPLTPRIFFAVINTHFDRYMINLLGTLGGVGIYEIGQKLSNSIFIFMTALQQIFSPNVYKKMFSKNKSEFLSIGKYLTPFFFMCVLFAMPIALFSKEILFLFFPEEFQYGAPVISILSVLYIVYFFGKQPQLMYAKRTGLISWLTFFSIFLNVSLNIPFIYTYGYLGAAWATLISGIISTSLNLYYGQKYTPIKYERKMIIILIYFVFVVLLNLMQQNFIKDNLAQIVIKLISILILIFMGLYFKIFKKINLLK